MEKNKIIIILALLIITLLLSMVVVFEKHEKKEVEINFSEIKKENIEIKERDGLKYIVDPDKLSSGGPPKDGIPSIDKPKFVSKDEADKWIEDNELVIFIDYRGVKRVYPLQILVWHEIVNDTLAGDPVVITYCPLCGSGIAYKRKIGENTFEFGTSGKLYNSNLVMYDRQTDSMWTQIEGLAIIGEMSGVKLEAISIDTLVWRNLKEADTDFEVLSKKTGFIRSYGSDPYGSYYEDSFTWFPLENEDKRVHPKTVIFGIELNGEFKAYQESDLVIGKKIKDHFGGVDIEISKDSTGIVKFINLETGEEVIKEREFWFAWYAFHPETELYSLK